ncbi:MAG: hypothetical protein WC569_02815 [Candidatus Omnitrophota bacterium]
MLKTCRHGSTVLEKQFPQSRGEGMNDLACNEYSDLEQTISNFRGLSKDEIMKYVEIARAKAKRGTCYLCRLIALKEHPRDVSGNETFPERSRILHLTICCDPESEWNIKNYGNSGN